MFVSDFDVSVKVSQTKNKMFTLKKTPSNFGKEVGVGAGQDKHVGSVRSCHWKWPFESRFLMFLSPFPSCLSLATAHKLVLSEIQIPPKIKCSIPFKFGRPWSNFDQGLPKQKVLNVFIYIFSRICSV